MVQGLKKLKILKRALCILLTLSILLCLTDIPNISAHAEEEIKEPVDYYSYPDYDVGTYGNVEAMKYLQNLTVTLNGVTYTQKQLKDLKDAGKQVVAKMGEHLFVHFDCGISGYVEKEDDPTDTDIEKSTHVIYKNATTYLDGTYVAAGDRGVLDDSSLLEANKTPEDSFFRFDLGWTNTVSSASTSDILKDYTGEKLKLVQESGTDKAIMYCPDGLPKNKPYATIKISIELVVDKIFDNIPIQGIPGNYYPDSYYPDKDFWQLDIKSENTITGDGGGGGFSSIVVKKQWNVPEGVTPKDATIIMHYQRNGIDKYPKRVLTPDNPTGEYLMPYSDMKFIDIKEDMTGMDDYECSVEVIKNNNAEWPTYIYTNTYKQKYLFSKRAVGGTDELPGAELTLYPLSIGEDGEETKGDAISNWTSGDMPNEIALVPGDYCIIENTAPDGYAAIDEFKFKVNKDYTVTLDDGSQGNVDGTNIVLYDEPFSVKLVKTDFSNNYLPGATLQLWDVTDSTNEKLVDEWVSTNEPHETVCKGNQDVALVAGNTYRFHEVTPPDGYDLSEDISFTLNKDSSQNIITMKDELSTEVTVQKIWIDNQGNKITDTHNLPEITLQLQQLVYDGETLQETKNFGDKVIVKYSDEWKNTWKGMPKRGTDDTGKAVTYKYKVEEVDVPDGYVVSYNNNDGIEIGSITVTNKNSVYTLLSTGGKGKMLYYIAGSILMMIALLIGFKIKRKHKKSYNL